MSTILTKAKFNRFALIPHKSNGKNIFRVSVGSGQYNVLFSLHIIVTGTGALTVCRTLISALIPQTKTGKIS